jgi:hypothetical protein
MMRSQVFSMMVALGLSAASAGVQAANHPLNLPSSTTANGTLPSSTTANCTEIPPGAGAPVCFLFSGGAGTLAAVCLFPLGLVVARRRRKG